MVDEHISTINKINKNNDTPANKTKIFNDSKNNKLHVLTLTVFASNFSKYDKGNNSITLSISILFPQNCCRNQKKNQDLDQYNQHSLIYNYFQHEQIALSNQFYYRIVIIMTALYQHSLIGEGNEKSLSELEESKSDSHDY